MVVPFLIAYIFNWVVYSIIIFSLLRKNFQSNIKSKNSLKIKFVCKQLIRAVILSILFGLGWDTQDIHTNKMERDLFVALFVIITAFHGLFIFIMQCLRSKEVNNTWKQWFFYVLGKDFNELTIFATKHNKPVVRVTNFVV